MIPWGKKVQISRNSKNLANIPYLVHAGVEAVGLVAERDVKQDPLVLEEGIQLTRANQ